LEINPLFKITNIQELTGLNAYKRCIQNIKDDYNLSSEQLIALKNKQLKFMSFSSILLI
jgi:hypothetical protein